MTKIQIEEIINEADRSTYPDEKSVLRNEATRDLHAMIQEFHRPHLSDLVECVYSWHMKREHKTRWGDKTPTYIAVVPRLARLFPGARFIHLIRDGHDVAASFQRQEWYGTWLHANAREWLAAAKFDDSWKETRIEHQILRVRYEDLILEAEKTLRVICRFIDEEFEPQMVSWEKSVDASIPTRERRIHQKLKNRSSVNDTYRWKREMSGRQIWVSESFMGVQLHQLGYERKYQSALWAPAMLATRVLCQLALPTINFQRRAFSYLARRIHRWTRIGR